MAKSGITKERAALEARRARLETNLSADQNWRALRQFRAQADGDDSDACRVRDARLELLLLANPIFRAWKKVDDAIEALDKSEAQVDLPPSRGSELLLPPLPLTSRNSPKEVASLADLSRGIARLIERTPAGGDRDRKRAPVSSEMEEAPLPVAHQASGPGPVAAAVSAEPGAEIEPQAGLIADAASPEPEAEVESEAGAIVAVAPPEPEAEVGSEPTPIADEASREPEIEIEEEHFAIAPASSAAPGVKSEREPAVALVPQAEPAAVPAASTAAPSALPPRGRPKKVRGDRPADRPWMVAMETTRDEKPVDNGAVVEEASVTFVERDFPPSRHATASSSGHPSTAVDDGEVSYPLGAEIEEAEVTILKANQIEERRRTDQRDGNLRRFRKALLGD